MFITFEGVDGAGKTTQVKLAVETLRAMGYTVTVTREPGGTPVAEKLRSVVLTGEAGSMDAHTELLIFTAARRNHIQKVILPALERGEIVICDRYVGSTYALQGAAGVPADLIKSLHETFCGLNPALTIFMDLDAEEGLRRSMARLGIQPDAEGRFESKGTDFHRKVTDILRAQAKASARENPDWTTIDASGSPEEVAERVMGVIEPHLHMAARRAETA